MPATAMPERWRTAPETGPACGPGGRRQGRLRQGPQRCGAGAGGHRARGIGDPAAPGAGEHARAGQTGVFHRQQEVAGGDAGAAHQHRFGRRAAVQQGLQLGAQFGRRAEAAVAQVQRERPVERAGHVPGDRVDRLDLAAEALAAARVQQPARRLAKARQHLGRIGDARAIEPRRWIRRQRRRHRRIGGFRQAGRAPCGQAAVQHRHPAMAQQPEQPPRARRGHAAVARVVDHDLVLRADAPPADPAGEVRRGRQGMPAQPCERMVGKVAVQVCMRRAGQVRSRPGHRAGGRIGQHRARVEQAQRRDRRGRMRRIAHRLAQLLDGNQGGPVRIAHAPSSRRRRRLYRIAAVAPQMRCPGQSYSSTLRARPRNSISTWRTCAADIR